MPHQSPAAIVVCCLLLTGGIGQLEAQDVFNSSSRNSKCQQALDQVENEYSAKMRDLKRRSTALSEEYQKKSSGCPGGDPGKDCRTDIAHQYDIENNKIQHAADKADAERKRAKSKVESGVCADPGVRGSNSQSPNGQGEDRIDATGDGKPTRRGGTQPSSTDGFRLPPDVPRTPGTVHNTNYASPPAGKDEGDKIVDLTCVDDALVGAIIVRDSDGIQSIRIVCATVKQDARGRWTWTSYHDGRSAGDPGNGTQIPVVCPQGYVVSGFRAALDASQDRVRDVTFECALITGGPKGYLGTFQLLGSNYPVADQGTPNGMGTGAFSRTSQMPANRRREPRTWAARTTPLATGPLVITSTQGYGASGLSAGTRANNPSGFGKSIVHSLAVTTGGTTKTTYPK